jgi:tRNA1Val (adenine37-N6)-methyltransferase
LNSFFQFKRFIINQDKCAMKVCTDACLFGAWVAHKLQKKEIEVTRIFDIGTGTGLLTLMLAQNTNAKIDTIEIDNPAFLQATENIEASPWAAQIHISNGSVTDYIATEKYDLIVCNPPFYENQLKSDNESKNAAMHSTTLSFSALALVIKNNLNTNGIAAILIPYNRVNDFVQELENVKLFSKEQLNIRHSPNKKFFRSVLIISPQKSIFIENSISIKNNADEYSIEFIDLLKDYYLHF